MIERARLATPAATIEMLDIQQPGTRGQQMRISLRGPDPLLGATRIVFDGDGRQIYSSVTRLRSLPQQLLLATQPIHFGWFGGMGVKIAYGLLGIALCVTTPTGAQIWLRRRRDKGHPAPVCERLWITIKWGQPLGIALAIWGALVSKSEALPVVVWFIASAATLLSATFLNDADRLERWLRIALAFVLVAVAASHVCR
ncbi:PepSY domain-containing protein [Sphingobium ummariense]